MDKEKLEKIALIGIILIGLGYAYVTFFFQAEWTAIQGATTQLQTRESYYQELLTNQKNQGELQQKIKTVETKVDQLNTQIPNQLDKPQIMVALYALAKQHSIYPQSIAFEQSQTKGTYQELGMTFSCLGKPADILAMIHDLQFGGGQRLAISGITLSTQQGTMQADLKLSAYASLGISSGATQKPDFMNSPIGVDTPAKMFQ